MLEIAIKDMTIRYSHLIYIIDASAILFELTN